MVDRELEVLCEYEIVGDRDSDELAEVEGETDAERQSVGVTDSEEEGDALTLAESVVESVPEHDPPKHGTGAAPHDAGKLVSTLSAPSVSTASSTPAAAMTGVPVKKAPVVCVYVHSAVPVAPASA